MLNTKKLSMKLLKLTTITLISLSLTMLLTSCETLQAPSKDLLNDCSIPYLKPGPAVNKDVVILAIEREYALKSCNLDKKALRAWYEAQCRGVFKRCVYERK